MFTFRARRSSRPKIGLYNLKNLKMKELIKITQHNGNSFCDFVNKMSMVFALGQKRE